VLILVELFYPSVFPDLQTCWKFCGSSMTVGGVGSVNKQHKRVNACTQTTCEGVALEDVNSHVMWTGPLHSDGFQPPPVLSTDSTMVPQHFPNGVSCTAIATCILLGYILISHFSSFSVVITDVFLSFLTHTETRICPVFSTTHVVIEVALFDTIINMGLYKLLWTLGQKFCVW
jgi:hypothetical protein